MNVPAFLLGRPAALSAAVTGAGVIVVLVVGVFLTALSAMEGSRQDDLDQLAQLNARAADIPRLKQALTTERLQAKALASLVAGDNEAGAQAALQREIKSLVEANGGEVRSSLVLPSQRVQGLSAISVQYELSLPVTKLRDLSYAIENHAPYFFISDANVSAPQSWPTDAKGPTPHIDVRWTVRAYRWSSAP
ncbi:MAG: hypothetical protein ISQ86_12545 [Alphaproteobacteria bacterium]|nr:hypothetical protein [Alphaproteobacteria bacterium]